MRAVLAGQPRAAPIRARTASTPRLDGGVRLDAPATSAYAFAAPVEVAARLEDLADLRQRAGVGRIERDRLAEVLERARRRRPSAARRRPARDRGTGCRASSRSPPRTPASPRRAGRPARRLARARHVLLDAAEPQHLDAARRSRQRRIGGERRFERRERVGVAVERRAAPGRGRRAPSTSARRWQLERAIEVRQRRLRILPRQLDVPERGLGRIEAGAAFSAAANSRSAFLQIAGLQERPAARLADAGRGCRPAPAAPPAA